jgi:hypothetical protein
MERDKPAQQGSKTAFASQQKKNAAEAERRFWSIPRRKHIKGERFGLPGRSCISWHANSPYAMCRAMNRTSGTPGRRTNRNRYDNLLCQV